MAIKIEVDDPRFTNADVANLVRVGLAKTYTSHLTVIRKGRVVVLRGPERATEIKRLTLLAKILEGGSRDVEAV